MVVNVTFSAGKGAEDLYQIYNFEKGIVPLKAEIFHPQYASMIKIVPNANVFLELGIWKMKNVTDLEED